MPGHLALSMGEEKIVATAVWETLPLERQQEVTLQLARILAASVEAERDE